MFELTYLHKTLCAITTLRYVISTIWSSINLHKFNGHFKNYLLSISCIHIFNKRLILTFYVFCASDIHFQWLIYNKIIGFEKYQHSNIYIYLAVIKMCLSHVTVSFSSHPFSLHVCVCVCVCVCVMCTCMCMCM